MKSIKVALTALLLTMCSFAFAQNMTVKGVVKDASNGETVPGASVFVIGTTIGTVTDLDGNYSISVPANGVLSFSSIGYKTVKITPKGSVLNVEFEKDYEYLDEVEEVLAPTGEPNESQYEYAYDVFFFSEVAPVHFMSYHEALFLKAEAEARLGQDASETLQAAIAAAFDNLEVNVAGAMESPSINTYGGLDPIYEGALTADDAEDYYESTVKALYEADPLKEVMLQKYIALWGANGETLETYADIRRLKAEGKDVYGLINPGKFPLRCAYGNDDVVSNPNIASLYGDGQYVFTENVWWAGGSR